MKRENMSESKVAERWDRHLERLVESNRRHLDEKTVGEIYDEVVCEHILLEAEGADESEANARAIEFANSFIATILKTKKSEPTVKLTTVTTLTAEPQELTYPTLPIDPTPFTHNGLISRSTELASAFRMEKDYGKIRQEFLMISLALNQFKLLAPVFREQPRMPFKKTEWKRHTQILIDQIVIDLHWLHCRGEQVRPRWPELGTLLSPSREFDCDAVATQLAARSWTSDFRVLELIFVNDRQQRQLMQLRTQKLKETFRSILEGKGRPDKGPGRASPTVAKVRMAIVNWADRTHQIRGHEDMYESLWVARELLGNKVTNDDIGELAALRCGTPPLDRKTVAGKLKRLDDKLKEAGVM